MPSHRGYYSISAMLHAAPLSYNPRAVQVATQPNEQWSLDLMVDSLADGCRFRVLTIVDNVSRVSPAIEVDFSLPGSRVVAVLYRLAATVGIPQVLSVEGGPEFISKALDEWAYRHGVQIAFNRPGTPTDNPFVESFNGHFREKCLSQHWFLTLEEVHPSVITYAIAVAHTGGTDAALTRRSLGSTLEFGDADRPSADRRVLI